VKPIGVIPTYIANVGDIALLVDCVTSLRATAGDALDVLIVDDCSPEPLLLDAFEQDYKPSLQFDVFRKEENTGFSKTVNVGLEHALEAGADAVLINADIEFEDSGWLGAMLAQENLHGDGLAAVVGARLLYPNGLLQHAGIYFSLLNRTFDHLHKFGPADLGAALVSRSCPVTGALQLIRHEALTGVGLYDDEFQMGWEDVDYCLRTFLSGRECVYCPEAVAIHHESVFRGRPNEKVRTWQEDSFRRIGEKYADVNMATLVPFL
jgi:GT2 family glycosyltransferase